MTHSRYETRHTQVGKYDDPCDLEQPHHISPAPCKRRFFCYISGTYGGEGVGGMVSFGGLFGSIYGGESSSASPERFCKYPPPNNETISFEEKVQYSTLFFFRVTASSRTKRIVHFIRLLLAFLSYYLYFVSHKCILLDL